MIKFLNLPSVKILDSGIRELTSDFRVQIKYKGKSYLVRCPEGMKTDLASVPKIFWSFFPKDDPEYLKSALFHDWLYFNGGKIEALELATNKRVKLKISRLDSDKFFKEGARILGSSWFKRNAIYSAVRIGGSSAFNGKKKRKSNPKKTREWTSRANPDKRVRG